jgi:dienelactone hydrolase
MQPTTRRRLLGAAGVGALTVLAGCSALQSDSNETTSDPTAVTTATDAPETTTPTSPGSTATTSDAPSTPPDDDGEPTDTPDSPSEAELEAMAREYVRLLAEGEFEAAHERLTPATQEQLSVDRLERVWNGVVAQEGPYRDLADVRYGTSQGDPAVVATIRFRSGRRQVQMAFDGDRVRAILIRQPEDYEWTPPQYVDTDAFAETEVSLPATDACSLGGTLTMPAGDGQVPGVVLVHGNGPQDRDETVGPNKTFKDLAWGLASEGIAVLRYDKRTRACDVDPASTTIDEVVTDDALAAIERLRAHDRVASEDVVLAGHSIGGTLAPRIAARDGDLGGVVMLAPLGRSAADAIVDQTRYLFEFDGDLSEAEAERLEEVRATAEQIRTLDIGDDEVVLFGGREYWRTMTGYDRFETARAVEAPLFLLFGGRDYQVTVEEDRPLWLDALDGRENATVRTYDRLNHHFMPGEGPPTRTEYYDENNVASRVVEDVATWTADVTGTRRDAGTESATDG